MLRLTAFVAALALVACSGPMPSPEADERADATDQVEAADPACVPPWDESVGSPELPRCLTEAQAIELARAAAPQSADFPATVAYPGPARSFSAVALRGNLPEDRWVWYVLLSDLGPLSGTGSMVLLDYVDGHVYEVIDVEG